MAASPGDWLVAAADRWPERTALIDPTGRVTFAGAHARASALAARFAADGVHPGDRVVLQLDNGVPLALLVLALWHLGAVPVPVLPMLRARELGTVLTEAAPAAVVGASADAGPLDHALAAGAGPTLRYTIGAPRAGWRHLPGTDPAAAAAGAGGDPRTAPNGTDALLLFTSGTTAQPKGVRHGLDALVAAADTYVRSAGLQRDDVVLVPASMAHVGGLVGAVVLPTRTGAPTVLLPRWRVLDAVELAAAERVTFAAGAVPVLADLVAHYENHPDAYRIGRFHTGAAPTSAGLIERAERCGVVAWRSWGMTECPNATVSRHDAPLADRAATDGRIEPGLEIRAVDEQARAVPTGGIGRLRVRGTKVMRGYTPGAGSGGLDPNGWFDTGDLGSIDAEGRVTVTGRTKDVIHRGGETFAAGEIEDAIRAHPAVADVAVVGRPDERLGEQVVAFLTLRDGPYPGDADLLAHLEVQGLARPKFPVAWTVLARLPRNANGKIVKAELGTWARP